MGYISRVYHAIQIKITLEKRLHLDIDTFINYSKNKKNKKIANRIRIHLSKNVYNNALQNAMSYQS